jgi:predicted glycoside hydrolase/deacetylase ChbG (UPF0249 family)
MSYWSENPELYDKIIVEELLNRELISEAVAEAFEDYVIVHHFYTHPDFVDICTKAEQAYWGDRVDEAQNRMEER